MINDFLPGTLFIHDIIIGDNSDGTTYHVEGQWVTIVNDANEVMREIHFETNYAAYIAAKTLSLIVSNANELDNEKLDGIIEGIKTLVDTYM